MLAIVLALCAIAVPAAAARPVPAAPACSDCTYGPIADVAPLHPAISAPAVIRVESPRGFEWGDAVIGAATGIALVVIAVGVPLARSGRHRRRTGRSSAALS
ncbi:MAG: hypothetical protein JO152_06540 [Mycobacteriaceae bacterium]|nr:hypothetical protein [Mycobacteriaceae bacterium]